ncbi:MAG: uracil-DNA glycosylase [Pirellulaceae bacterium]
MQISTEEHLRQVLLQMLESLQQSGVRDMPRAARRRKPHAGDPAPAPPCTPLTFAVPTQETATLPPSASAPSPPPSPSIPFTKDAEMPPAKSLSLAKREAALERMAGEVAVCPRCAELVATRTQTVFGVGNPRARLVFLGEAPGAEEDRQGEPFVGRAGQLLNKILEACTLQREDVYILNIVKCRPPGNRNPTPMEAANCRPFLLGQLEIIRPEFICCLGAVAAQNLLETTASIGQLRGRIHHFGQAQVIATYHPAYLLRNPAAKRATWDDMKLLLQAMGIVIPIPDR